MDKSKDLATSKPHYEILDGLRGVAAVLVVLFHVFEIYSGGDHTKQIINHGYLAVDFFFLLSGFVIAYAYDDRWGKMTLSDFFKRRVIRLQPMVIIGMLIGALLFYFQDAPELGWGGIHNVPVWKLLLVLVIGFTLLPVGKSLDIRGWNEMHPLNGPGWSLFFEYIANIAYALFLRKTSKKILSFLVLIAAFITIQYAFSNANGDIIGGWSIDDSTQLRIGFTRLAFPFLCGLLMARVGKLVHLKNAFLFSSLLLVVCLSIPHLGGNDNIWNRLYECVSLIIIFPIIIWIGAGGKIQSKKTSKICRFLGNISYPLYITHYPIVYTYYAWIKNNNLTIEESWYYGLLVALITIIVAHFSMKFYDIPIRKWLRKRFL